MNKTLKNKYFYLSLVLLVAIIFLLQNNRPVEIDFLFWSFASANLLILLLTFFIFGAATGYFGNQIYRLKKKSKIAKNARSQAAQARDRAGARSYRPETT